MRSDGLFPADGYVESLVISSTNAITTASHLECIVCEELIPRTIPQLSNGGIVHGE